MPPSPLIWLWSCVVSFLSQPPCTKHLFDLLSTLVLPLWWYGIACGTSLQTGGESDLKRGKAVGKSISLTGHWLSAARIHTRLFLAEGLRARPEDPGSLITAATAQEQPLTTPAGSKKKSLYCPFTLPSTWYALTGWWLHYGAFLSLKPKNCGSRHGTHGDRRGNVSRFKYSPSACNASTWCYLWCWAARNITVSSGRTFLRSTQLKTPAMGSVDHSTGYVLTSKQWIQFLSIQKCKWTDRISWQDSGKYWLICGRLWIVIALPYTIIVSKWFINSRWSVLGRKWGFLWAHYIFDLGIKLSSVGNQWEPKWTGRCRVAYSLWN